MLEVKRDFLNNNHSYINFILDKIESFSNLHRSKVIYPKNHPNYNNLTMEQIKVEFFTLLKDNKEAFISEIEKNLGVFELTMNDSLPSGSMHETINFSFKLKNQKDLDMVLKFKYTIYSKEASFESIEIQNKNCNGSLWNFKSLSKSIIIPLGKENEKQNKSDLAYLEIVTEKEKITDYIGLSNSYEGLFQLRKDHTASNVLYDRTDTDNTHNFYEKIHQLNTQHPEVAYKCLFSNTKNIEDLSDLMLLNYDIVFDEHLKRFHANLDDFYNIKILGNEVNMLEYERKMKRALPSFKI